MRRRVLQIGSVTLVLGALMLWAGTAFAVPSSLTHQGRLLDDDGTPKTGQATLKFTIYDKKSGGSIVWESKEKQVDLGDSGFYSVTLGGSSNPVDGTKLQGDSLWIGLAVDGNDELSPRIRLRSVPYAVRAGSVDNVDWKNVGNKPMGVDDGDDDALGGLQCTSGQVPQWDGSQWTCSTSGGTYSGDDFAVSNQSCNMGDVVTGIDNKGQLQCAADSDTTYSAGNGLTLNSNTFNLAQQSCMSGQVAVGIDANGAIQCANDSDTTYSKNCPAGQVVSSLGPNGSVTCIADSDTTYSAGPGINQSGTTFSLASQSCPSGQVATGIQSGGIQCANDQVNNYSGGTGINVSSSTISLDTSYASGLYVNESGDTMTGSLTVQGNTSVNGTFRNDENWFYFNDAHQQYGAYLNFGDDSSGFEYLEYETSVGPRFEFTDDVYVYGSLGASTKNFIHPHPDDPSKEIVYVCQEGGENGVYWRGTAETYDGRAVVEMPEHFASVASEEGLSATVSPKGQWAPLFVKRVTPSKLIVNVAEQGPQDVEFSYRVEGVRRHFEDHDAVQPNTHFVPDESGNAKKFVEFASKNPGIRKTLIENGILNRDGSLNRKTAKKLGWSPRQQNR